MLAAPHPSQAKRVFVLHLEQPRWDGQLRDRLVFPPGAGVRVDMAFFPVHAGRRVDVAIERNGAARTVEMDLI